MIAGDNENNRSPISQKHVLAVQWPFPEAVRRLNNQYPTKEFC